MAPRGLTPRRARFVEEYLVDLNATRAAVRAGYSPGVADREGYRLLRNAEVAAAIQAARAVRSSALILDAQKVQMEWSRVGNSDMRDYIEWGPDGVKIKPSSELTDDQARAVMSVTEKRRTIPQRSGEPIEEVEMSFKLHPKIAALDSLAKAHGLFDAKGGASKQLDMVLEVVLLLLRKYVPPERIERAVKDFGALLDDATKGEHAVPAVTVS